MYVFQLPFVGEWLGVYWNRYAPARRIPEDMAVAARAAGKESSRGLSLWTADDTRAYKEQFLERGGLQQYRAMLCYYRNIWNPRVLLPSLYSSSIAGGGGGWGGGKK